MRFPQFFSRHEAVLALFFFFTGAFLPVTTFFQAPPPVGFSLYEGVKIAFFFVLTGFLWTAYRHEIQSGLVRLVRESVVRPPRFQRFVPVLAGGLLTAFWAASLVLHGSDGMYAVFLGRTYSFVCVAWLVLFYLAFSQLEAETRKEAWYWLVYGFAVWNFPYAVFQFFWFDPVTAYLAFPGWGENRAFGTVGNPNGLAFFAVLALPMVLRLRSAASRNVLAFALVALVLLSKSLSGLAVMAVYAGFVFASRFRNGKVFAVTVALLLISLWVFVGRTPLKENLRIKTLSLETRLAIAADSAEALGSNLETFFFWRGERAVESLFDASRSDRVSRYVAKDVPIDRAHSVFLDLALAFWVPFAMTTLASLVLLAKKNPERASLEALGIFCILGSFHTPWISEWVLLLTVLSVRPIRSVSVGTA